MNNLYIDEKITFILLLSLHKSENQTIGFDENFELVSARFSLLIFNISLYSSMIKFHNLADLASLFCTSKITNNFSLCSERL